MAPLAPPGCVGPEIVVENVIRYEMSGNFKSLNNKNNSWKGLQMYEES